MTNIQPSLNENIPTPTHPSVTAQLEVSSSVLVVFDLEGFWGQLPSAQTSKADAVVPKDSKSSQLMFKVLYNYMYLVTHKERTHRNVYVFLLKLRALL